MRWVESQPNPIVFLILVGLYILVSLPIAWGYIAINIATGYLYGLKVGLVVTVISATIGIIIAHYLMKTFLASYVERYIAYTFCSTQNVHHNQLKIAIILQPNIKKHVHLVLYSKKRLNRIMTQRS